MTDSVLPVPLTRGYVALVDASDYPRVIAAGRWHARPHGRTVYAQRHISLSDGRRSTQQMHNFITGVIGVDHVNGDGLDNRRTNLRVTTQAQNCANTRRRSNNKSGFKGVSWKANSRAWVAQIKRGDKSHHLGLFSDPEEAARAYDAAAVELFGEYARTNFPKENAS
jgi:AP2 domain.